MSFLNPFFLWSLGLIGVPILIHLIFRQAFRRQEWAAMEFLLRALKKMRRRLLLENLLLLLLRVLVVACLVAAFARPVVRLALPGMKALTRGDRDLVIVVDASYSMQYRDGARRAFDKAVEQALELAGAVAGKDAVALVTASDRPEVHLEFSPNPQSVEKALKNLKAGAGATDVAATLRKVKELVADPRHRGRGPRRVVFLTDLMRHGWVVKGRTVEEVEKLLGELAPQVSRFLLVDVGPGQQAGNLSVDRVWSPDKIVGANLPTQFLATVSNRGSQPAHGVRVHFLAGGDRRDTKTLDVLEPRRSKDVVFSEIFPRPGPSWVTVEVEGDKHLALDDRRHHAFQVVERIKVLLVDGDPQGWSERAETHYLVNALAPQAGDGGSAVRHLFEPRQMDRTQFHRLRLAGSGYDLVVLANVSYLSEEKELELEEFVKRGGGLLIFLGDEVRADVYNKRLLDERKLLPARLADKPAGQVGETAARLRLAPADYGHPLFWFFRDLQFLFREELVGQYWPVTPEKSRAVTVLARYTDPAASPAIVERSLGAGKVLLVTTSADQDWNLLTNAQVYVPLVHETMFYLVARAAAGRNLPVHTPIEFSVREYAHEVRVARPDVRGFPGKEEEKLPRITEAFRYDRTDLPGVYRVELDRVRGGAAGDQQKVTERIYYSAGLEPEEGDLEHLGEASLVKRYPALARPPFGFSRQARTIAGDAGVQKEGEVWHLLVLAALVFLLAESLLAQRMGK